MSNQEYVQKKEKIFSLLMETDDMMVARFLDPEGDELLDDKIEVLTELKRGKKPEEIPNYYKVLNIPEGQRWD